MVGRACVLRPCSRRPTRAALLSNPELDRGDAVALLVPESSSETFGRFLAILAEAHRLPLLPEIAGMYDQLRADAEHVVKATVTSATELSAAELDAIKAALRKRFGREVDVSTAVDASLIGVPSSTPATWSSMARSRASCRACRPRSLTEFI